MESRLSYDSTIAHGALLKRKLKQMLETTKENVLRWKMVSLQKPIERFKRDAEDLLLQLEERRGRVVIPLLYSTRRIIARPDVDELYDALISMGKQPKIDVILSSLGGDPDQAYIMGNMLQEFAEEKLTVIAPRYAKSAAMLIACAGDEIVLGPASELGSLDIIVKVGDKYVSIESIRKLLEMIKEGKFGDFGLRVLENLPILELGDYSRLRAYIKSLAGKLLARRMFKDEPDVAGSVAQALGESYTPHVAAVISANIKGKLKLANIDPESWSVIWRLHRLWADAILRYEAKLSGKNSGPLNFRLGKGLVFCTTSMARAT